MRHQCRHFKGIAARFHKEPICAKGHNVYALAGPEPGMFFRLPCAISARDGEAFTCADLDRFTDQEVQEREDNFREHARVVMEGMNKVLEIKDAMIKTSCDRWIDNCPWCGGEASLHVSVAPKVNNHVAANCKNCGRSILE